MEAVSSSGFWWLKSNKSFRGYSKSEEDEGNITSMPKQSDDPSTVSSSLREFLEKERAAQSSGDADTDIGIIIEEINKLAAESPLGPYEIKDSDDRSVEEIMREAEKIYLESSRSFEQLSARSRTSANLSVSFNDTPKSTPTPKSASPLPLDSDRIADNEPFQKNQNKEESYSDDFIHGDDSEFQIIRDPISVVSTSSKHEELSTNKDDISGSSKVLNIEENNTKENFGGILNKSCKGSQNLVTLISDSYNTFPERKGQDFQNNEKAVDYVSSAENRKDQEVLPQLEENVTVLKSHSEETSQFFAKTFCSRDSVNSPEVNAELDKVLEELKDAKETSTALQLQFEGFNKTHQLLKITYDELLRSNDNLEKRLLDAESVLVKHKSELQNVQEHREKLLESESNLNKLLEIERLQVKSLKSQNEKDARCIQDLNRQVKEMERIIARKHPDSVSALIVAAKGDQTENNLTARKLLEDRIKTLEAEVATRDQQSSKVFVEVQEKFSEMKNKYESHIEDLELHVNDLKEQLKRKIDTFDVYTQTFFDDEKVPVKEAKDASVQTINAVRIQKVSSSIKKSEKVDTKEETHLLATIRGLQTDIVNKEKVVLKLQKELDEVKKTNKRLQREREGSLKNIAERREFRSYPERLTTHLRTNDGVVTSELEEELRAVKIEKDKMKIQLCRMEEDYQNLKAKRLFDLSALQQAHEEEISTYMTNITSLREQLKLQQSTINTLQDQLLAAKKQLEILKRDDNRLHYDGVLGLSESNSNGNENGDDLRDLPPHKKIAALEQRYQERECRLRTIVHGLAQKNVASLGCQQCAARQEQLILYKTELDQLLASLRTLT